MEHLFDPGPYTKTAPPLREGRGHWVTSDLRTKIGEQAKEAPDASQAASQAISQRVPVIRADTGSAYKILQDGQFKNQFHTGTSNGSYTPELRSYTEEKLFGIDEGEGADSRPIYGYMEPKPGHSAHKREAGNTEHYGGARFYLKPEVESRSTVTAGDSLCSDRPAVPVRDAKRGTIPFGFSPGEHNTHASGDPSDYYELQVHGGVSPTEDVSHIELTTDRYSPAGDVKKMARHRGIPYAERDMTEKYDQGRMVRKRTQHSTGEHFEEAMDDGPSWSRFSHDRGDPASSSGTDTVTRERWNPQLPEPVVRKPYTVMKTPQEAW